MATKPDNPALKDGLKAVWRSARNSQGRPAPGAPPPTRSEADGAPEPDAALFQAAMAGAAPIPADNRADPGRRPSRRIVVRDTGTHESPGKRPENAQEAALPGHWHDGETNPSPLSHDPELRALQLAMAGVQPLPDKNIAQAEKPRPAPRPRQSVADRQAVLHESLHAPIGLQDRLEGGDEAHYLRDGLAASVLRDLRRGRWIIQDEIDLHGLTRDEARDALAIFLASGLQRGLRCVRVIHGKGHGSPQKLSILRQLVRGWLAQRQEVLAFCQAKPQDGGEGALLVLLRSAKTRT